MLNIVLICSLVSKRAVDFDAAESSGMNSFYALFIFLQQLKILPIFHYVNNVVIKSMFITFKMEICSAIFEVYYYILHV